MTNTATLSTLDPIPCPRCERGAYEECSRCRGTGTLLCEMHLSGGCGMYRAEAMAIIDGIGCCERAVGAIAACCAEDERLLGVAVRA